MSYSSDQSNGMVWKKPMIFGEEEDVWDDRALIEAYDRAVKQVNRRIADKYLESSDKTAINYVSNANHRKPNLQSWHLDQYCRCVYTEDGLEYEAKIISIDKTDDTCVVRYIGYGNEEQKGLKELKPSLGKRSRKLQKLQTDCSDTQDISSDPDVESNQPINRFGNEVKPQTKRAQNTYKMDSTPNTSWFMPSTTHSEPMAPSTQPIVPPPLPLGANASIPSDDESLASMLMSWYMSGYHTGYYTALKQSRHSTKKCNK